MREIRALFWLDVLRAKNFIKGIIKKPSRIFLYLSQFIWYIFWLIPVLLTRGKTAGEVVYPTKTIYLLVCIMVFLLLGLVISLYSSIKHPSIILGEGDVAFLLSSPIGERKIFLWHMLRVAFKNIGYAVLLVIYLPYLSIVLGIESYAKNLVFAYIGIFTFSLSLVPLEFLIYSITMKFGAEKFIRRCLGILLVLTVGLAVYHVYKQQSLRGLIDFLMLDGWNYLPVIGPSRHLIFLYFSPDTANNIPFIMYQMANIVFMVAAGLYFATDYYEEVVGYNEILKRIREKAKKGNYYEAEKSSAKKKKKVRRVEVKLELKGPWAFLWAKLVEARRSAGSLIFNYYNLVIIVISIIAGYFLPKNDKDLIFVGAFMYAYGVWLGTSTISAVVSELKRMYIYIIPGDGIKKLVAVSTVTILKTFIGAVAMIVPLSIFIKPGMLNIIASILFIMGVATLQNYSSLLLQLVLPSKTDLISIMPVVKWLGFIVILLPAGAVAVPLGMATDSMGIGVLAAAVMMFLESAAFLAFANLAFDRLELRDN
ncbi:putative ABC exporter domain-containing protein [Caldicoprobacter algeriensis]|uniref:putative ABC exporter domain-containing protein n=1 Tax=Caldicoprobacter algeriensis TaxID=699281 RepID=UPI00207A98D2|nr:putative ABC exporter domain-containing protein [Caldicoprobacter algeriensis]MCM8899752.1 putative ABC exporter domain-containing protein [Caldicoprobacter algeriensis]